MNDSDSAWALLALRSAPGSPSRVTWQGRHSPVENAIARLEGKGFEYMVRRDKIVIGRSTSREKIDVTMGHSAYISRHHLEIYHQTPNFYVKCISKNGIFVDGSFVRSDGEPKALPKSCTFRFPSTNIKLAFQSLINEEPIDLKMAQVGNFKPPAQSPQPVKDTCDFRSQPQSPADTISAANSCPTSPRPSTKWHTSSRTQPNSPQSSQHHNNNSNNINSNNNGNNIILSSAGYTEMFDQNFMDASEVILDTDGNSTVVPGGVVDNNIHHHMFYNSAQSSLSTTNNIGNMDGRSIFHHDSASAGVSHVGSSGRHHGDDGKPPYSYAQLIVQAISAAPDKQLTLNGIYSYITRNYPYYKTADKGWQNSIRHNLSLNRYFLKVPRNQEEPGKGSFWRIETSNETKLLDQAYRRRRKRENSNNSATPTQNPTNLDASLSQKSSGSCDGPGVKVEPCDEVSQSMDAMMEKSELLDDGHMLKTEDSNESHQEQTDQTVIEDKLLKQDTPTHPSMKMSGDEAKPQDVTTVVSCVSSIVSSVVSQGGNSDQ